MNLTFALKISTSIAHAAGEYQKHLTKGGIELILEMERIPLIEKPIPHKGHPK